MNKLVSIIIPAYNVAPYIAQCLDSVLSQTYQNIEIIVVNDGSTDTTAEIMSLYEKKDARIRVIYKENGGLSSARNAGLVTAIGEYLVIFDSDDIMMPQKIERQVAWLEAHPESDFVYSDLAHFYDGTTKVYKLTIPSLAEDSYEQLLKGNCINPNTICMRRVVYEKVGLFDEAIRSAEDWDYWLRLLSKGFKIEYQPEILTVYRMRKNSLSADHSTMCATALQVLEKQRTLSEVGYKNIIEDEIQRWKQKQDIAVLKKKIISTTGAKRFLYQVISFLIDMTRGIKLWLRLRPYNDVVIKSILKPYAK